ncbi:hypothetical protein CASFOL_025088 [Castilleja foliolosa]|uniref:HMA domain-containing protein n=1 Tax=Castilleja foliolosa TaxID=1961234 RepID=A0ABD3CSN0_9LAMI
MENHRCEQIHKVLLSMNISSCERCPRKLKKKLLSMPGVDSVSIDTEKNLILVTGTVDPNTLLNEVKKLGKRVKLVPTDEHHLWNEGQDQRDTPYRDHPCGRPHGKERVEAKKEEEPHKCEAYEMPKIDERVCRDFFCKTHPRSRSIVDKVSAPLFGGLPFHAGFGPYSYPPNMYYGDEFGYHHRPDPRYGHPGSYPRPFYYH